MRVIAGRLGGRTFNTPGTSKTHPMSERVRGALFNVLGDLAGLSVLDAYAGSGALSFEAISRGAVQVTSIESDRLAQKTIELNIARLEVEDRIKLVRAAVAAWLDTNATSGFDIVLCDPPYDGVQQPLLTRLAERVKSRGVVALSLPPKVNVVLPTTFQLAATKSYGDAQLVFFVRD